VGNVRRHASLMMIPAATSEFSNGNLTSLNRNLLFRKPLKQQAIYVCSCQSSIVNWTSLSSFGARSRNSSMIIVTTISRRWKRIYQRLWPPFTFTPLANGSNECIAGLRLTGQDLGHAMLKLWYVNSAPRSISRTGGSQMQLQELLISVCYCLYEHLGDAQNWPLLRSTSHSVLPLNKIPLGDLFVTSKGAYSQDRIYLAFFS